jgi:hypothetical protein
VCVCDVASGTMVSPGALQSSHKPYLWPHDKSLRVLATSGHVHIYFNIYEIGPTLLKIEFFSITLSDHGDPKTISFSPTAGQVSVVTHKHMLLVFNCQNSEILLKVADIFHGNYFSPNGSLLGAFGKDCIYVWQTPSRRDAYISRTSRQSVSFSGTIAPFSESYWKKIPFWSDSADLPQELQFSPTSSSVLISREGRLQVAHLDDLEAYHLQNPRHQYNKISTNGAYIVTAELGGNTVTITNIYPHLPPQIIHTSLGICGLALTGNVLLVDGAYGVVAWRLTANGAVEGIWGNEVADWDYKIWSCKRLVHGMAGPKSLVIGDTGIIQFHDGHLVCYNTDTGKCYESVPIQGPASSTAWHNLTDLGFYTHLPHHSFCEHRNTPDDTQPASIPSYKEGWVK